MKIFDYKLILLIALTFVIYFMYRELMNLNTRVDKIEKNINNVQPKIEQNVEPKFINFEQPIPQNNDQQFEETIPSNDMESNTRLNDILPNESCSVSTEDEESENLETMNKNNLEEINEEDAVEIYSNDNVEDVSSPDTSEATPVAEMKDMVIRDVDGSIMMSGDNNSSESEEMIDLNEDAMNLSASSMSSIDDEDINDIMTANQTVENQSIDEQSIENQSIENQSIENNSSDKISVKSSDKLTEESIKEVFNLDELMKNNKLRQLKEIAQQLNIELKDNGKAKTKKQLAEEIVSVKNNQ